MPGADVATNAPMTSAGCWTAAACVKGDCSRLDQPKTARGSDRMDLIDHVERPHGRAQIGIDRMTAQTADERDFLAALAGGKRSRALTCSLGDRLTGVDGCRFMEGPRGGQLPEKELSIDRRSD